MTICFPLLHKNINLLALSSHMRAGVVFLFIFQNRAQAFSENSASYIVANKKRFIDFLTLTIYVLSFSEVFFVEWKAKSSYSHL